MAKKPSWAAVRRLPRYFRHLSESEEQGEMKISSGVLASRMGLTASQVRQDFSFFGEFGQQGYGYNVSELRQSIAEILRLNDRRTAIILGAGNLGRALIHNFNFEKYGFTLSAAFDTDCAVIGTCINGVPVLSANNLREYLKDNRVDIGVLTLPRPAVRDTASVLTDGGVKGIWNFTSVDLHLDLPDIAVENVHFSEALMVLSYQLDTTHDND